MNDWFIILPVALLTGITASMGLGGGFILVIYLTIFAGIPQLQAQGINLIFFIPIAVLSLFFHIKNKLIEKQVLLPGILGEITGVFLGVGAAVLLGSWWLQKAFAVFVLLIGIREIIGVFRHKKDKKL
jgi:uncharacterized membrane protein YfcA